MNTLSKLSILILLMASIISCGAPSPGGITLSGSISLEGEIPSAGPLFLIISDTDNFNAIEEDPLNNIITMITVDPGGDFSLNLSDLGLNAGDTIYVSAFADNNYRNQLPYPDAGDIIGFYINNETKQPSHIITEGDNRINITVNREVFEYEASLSGTVTGTENGEVMLIAYHGEITSFDTESINTDLIMGYSRISKSETSSAFSLDIMPFGADIPLNNVYLMAILDKNGNGIPDGGDRLGFFADSDGIPERITIIEGRNSGLNLDITMDIPIPSGYQISLEGHPAIPAGYSTESPPLYIMVAETDNPGNLLNDATSTIRAFSKLDPGSIDFHLDLSSTALKPGDRVMVIGLWDKDNSGGFPKPTEGDLLGFYHTPDLADFSMTVTLKEGVNRVIPDASHSFTIDRTLYEYEATVTGTLSGAESGNAILIAYAGEITSMNAADLDVNKIIGYRELTLTGDNSPYSLDIMPLGFPLPVENVYVMALYDTNGNGIPDGGDRMGFHADGEGIPRRITVNEGNTPGIDIALTTDIPVPSGHTVSLEGNIETPAGYSTSSPPLYVMVTTATDPAALFDNPADYIISFQKLEPGATNFSLDLSSTALTPGDKVMVIALWDLDNTGGFPKPTPGDSIGFYHTTSLNDYQMEVSLVEGVNTIAAHDDWVFPVNRTLYDFDASITGSIDDAEAGEIILIAYAGQISSMDMNSLEVDSVIAYTTITKPAGSHNYSLPVMSVGHNVPIQPVYVMALHDVNGNGVPDGGDRLGYYTGGGDVPLAITVDAGITSNIDINFSTAIDTPSGFTISVEGNVTLPEGYNASSPPLYVMIADADSPDTLLENPAAHIRAFQKLAPGATNFSLDLSSTSLVPGNEVMVIALWDKDSTGGFPDPTPGDVMGFYRTKTMENYSMTVTLIEGVNSVIPDDDHAFSVDKTMYGYEASVSGNLTDEEASAVILIAHKGELTSLDASSLNIDNIIAYQTIDKTGGLQSYTLNILPLSFDVPMDDVYIIALYDRNGNGQPDGGDGMAYYSTGGGIPSPVSINAGETTGIDLSLSRDIETPSGFTITVSGAVDRPVGYGISSPPLYVLVTSEGDPAALFENPATAVRAYQKLDAGSTAFNIDLSSTSLTPGEKVMIIALWDKDSTGGFPQPTAGDMAGFYHTTSISSFEMSLTLAEGDNAVSSDGTWLFSANHTLVDHSAEIQGTLSGAGSGEVILIAYPEEITSMNVADIDVEKIIGYSTVTKGTGDTTYSLDILPFDYNVPISGVYVMALLDLNGNGIPDGGDRMGYYSSNSNGIPSRITIPDGITANINIALSMDIPAPSGFSMTLEGAFERPAGYDSSSAPMYIMVAKTDDPGALFDDPLSVIKSFVKIDAGRTDFSIDLSPTDLVPGDEVMVIALWDLDNNGGFPNPTPGANHTAGDRVGFYQNTNVDNFQVTVTLTDTVTNTAYHDPSGDWKFSINRDIYDYTTSIQFKLDTSDYSGTVIEGDTFIALAVHSDGATTSSITDINYVIAMEKLSYVNSAEHQYSLPVFTALYENIPDTAEMDIYVYAIHDLDGDGLPSTGDSIFAYWERIWILGFIYYPKTSHLISDQLNILSDPDNLHFVSEY